MISKIKEKIVHMNSLVESLRSINQKHLNKKLYEHSEAKVLCY